MPEATSSISERSAENGNYSSLVSPFTAVEGDLALLTDVMCHRVIPCEDAVCVVAKSHLQNKYNNHNNHNSACDY